MRPLIGISAGVHRVDDWPFLGQNRDIFESVIGAGGLPVLLPLVLAGGLTAGEVLDRLDGLILSGGPDPDPAFWGEEPHPRLGTVNPERDETELALARQAVARGLPLLGICRGAQMLAVALGGSLVQDIPSQVPAAIQHWQRAPRHYPFHTVRLSPDSQVASIYGASEIRTNSFHHQAVREVPPGWRVTGVTADGVIEAFEPAGPGFAIGVQWHPESPAARGATDPLFHALIAHSRRYNGGSQS